MKFERGKNDCLEIYAYLCSVIKNFCMIYSAQISERLTRQVTKISCGQ